MCCCWGRGRDDFCLNSVFTHHIRNCSARKPPNKRLHSDPWNQFRCVITMPWVDVCDGRSLPPPSAPQPVLLLVIPPPLISSVSLRVHHPAAVLGFALFLFVCCVLFCTCHTTRSAATLNPKSGGQWWISARTWWCSAVEARRSFIQCQELFLLPLLKD